MAMPQPEMGLFTSKFSSIIAIASLNLSRRRRDSERRFSDRSLKSYSPLPRSSFRSCRYSAIVEGISLLVERFGKYRGERSGPVQAAMAGDALHPHRRG